jgi:hypothetical protein
MIAKSPTAQTAPLGNRCHILRFAILPMSLLASTTVALGQSCEKNEYEVTKCVKQVASYDLTQVFMFREVEGRVFEFNNNCPVDLRVIAAFSSGETKTAKLSANSPTTPDIDKPSSSDIIVCETGINCAKIRWIACSSREANLPADEQAAEPPSPPIKPVATAKQPSPVENAGPAEPARIDPAPTPPPQGKDSSPAVRSTFQIRQNWDLAGQDLRSLTGLGVDECREACRMDGQCVGFTLDRWNRYCFLKSNLDGLRLEPKALSGWRDGMKPPVQSTAERVMEPYRKRRFSGNVIDSRTIEGANLCQSTCSESNQCVGFSFVTNSRQCSRFSQIENYFPDDGVVSGAKRQEPAH